MKILVTGGAGFIGSYFLKRQIANNSMGLSKIIVLDKLTYAGNLDNFTEYELEQIEFVHGDICDSSLVQKLLSEVEVVVNFAAESHVDRSISSASEFVVTNALGTQIMLENSVKSGIEKFVQVSTDEVYGSIEEGSWNEEFPLQPNSPYSASKASADLLVRSYNRTFGLNANITRCSNNYGNYQYPEKVIPLFITNLIEGKKIPIYGKGLNIRDWLHVDDHCRGIEAVVKGGRPGEIYNIGGGTELTNLQLADNILSLFGEDNSKIDHVSDRLGHDMRYSVDFEKIKTELGYLPEIDFEVGLRNTVAFYKSNLNWWKSLKAQS
jgi:dTDP-glucose 4,6-dehydratase